MYVYMNEEEGEKGGDIWMEMKGRKGEGGQSTSLPIYACTYT